jgi:hypothetical protein
MPTPAFSLNQWAQVLPCGGGDRLRGQVVEVKENGIFISYMVSIQERQKQVHV